MPDLGATLYYADLRVYDHAGLADKVIARTLGQDESRLYDYVFETTRPTFIVSYGVYAGWAKFDGDPRFRRDYVAICEKEDPSLKRWKGISMLSGEYVRREAVATANGAAFLAELRSGCASVPKGTRDTGRN
jgi:hypothetical protein